ncbi:MAG TPA: glycogen synthase GlgA [Chitinivibrionales bacterium]|nr:glycogen synthase GlgA [Chitinivibrionales bacterium]
MAAKKVKTKTKSPANKNISVPPPLKILVVASEMVPFVKAGGLSDIVGSLSSELKRMGHDVRVVLPKYSSINYRGLRVSPVLPSMGVWMGGVCEWCSVFSMTTEKGVPVYLIEHDLFFNRPGIYHDQSMHDYLDNARRYAFLSRAALQLCRDTGFSPDIVHANDWQTALAPAYLKVWHWNDALLGRTASVLTVHNMAYQGVYSRDNWAYMGLGDENFTEKKFESWGYINMLKGGIYFADAVNTVSPTYARETRTPAGGFGLAPYLNDKGANYEGILNGVDYDFWSPENDRYVAARFSADDMAGKAVCKRALQKEFLLRDDPKVALIGAIGRFVHQKGFELIAQSIERVLNDMHVQFAVLGSGEGGLEHYFGELPKRYPGRAGSFIGFNNRLAHLIESGADFLLMPSLNEPCGLNQLYSLRYGTLPIVRATGGLDDTVVSYNEATGEGTGFKFWEPSANALYYTVGWAVSTYYDRPQHLAQLRATAMRQDFSWKRSAQEYVKLYKKAILNKQEYDRRCRG